MNKFFTFLFLVLLGPIANADWFDDIRNGDNARDLYRLLYYMPKGGDLHNHLSGSVFSEALFEMALAEEARGYEYYTKVRIENCREYGGNEFGLQPYYLMFRTISQHEFAGLNDCEKGEYRRLRDLSSVEREAWMDSIRIDKAHEGREEFFQTHWQRLNALYFNPWIQAESMVWNMQALAKEGVSYVEFQVAGKGMQQSDGSFMLAEKVVDILRERLKQKDAIETGVTVRFQASLLRFTPNAEDDLRRLYKLVHDNSDLFVAVNMVGREDNDKGYPRRFLSTLRELRRMYSGVRLTIHAGEVDEPNNHVRETLLLGAERIGHGINLITDDDTMLLMRYGPYLVEISLISNLLLDYIDDYTMHPFPEYLRTGIPVALSTDDRGMWDSTVTDEFFVAVTEYNLSWEEVKTLSRNSLSHAFVQTEIKNKLLRSFDDRTAKFERAVSRTGVAKLGPMPETRQFICDRYELCD